MPPLRLHLVDIILTLTALLSGIGTRLFLHFLPRLPEGQTRRSLSLGSVRAVVAVAVLSGTVYGGLLLLSNFIWSWTFGATWQGLAIEASIVAVLAAVTGSIGYLIAGRLLRGVGCNN